MKHSKSERGALYIQICEKWRARAPVSSGSYVHVVGLSYKVAIFLFRVSLSIGIVTSGSISIGVLTVVPSKSTPLKPLPLGTLLTSLFRVNFVYPWV